MIKVFNRQVEVLPDHEIIRYINSNPGSYVPWIGAGTSVEAGVKTGRQICEELRKELASYAKPADEKTWAASELSWDDPARRYSTCLSKYGSAAKRVRYFRQLIQGLQPVFSHNASALLMEAKVFSRTCLTTNFDKLIEMAFAQQGNSECQAIRGEEETRYWQQEDDKCYVIKLHGDYDTHNILNTDDETIRIPKQLQRLVSELLRQKGLVFVGSSGYEGSVIRLLNDLIDDEDPTLLNMGLYWSVNIGAQRQEGLPFEEIEKRVAAKVEGGSVSKTLVELLARGTGKGKQCALFPVWGAGNFFFDLVEATENRAVIGQAKRYLDHTMRLRHVLARGGLSPDAIEKRLSKLGDKESERRRSGDLHVRSRQALRVWRARAKSGSLSVDVLYGDITSRSLLGAAEVALLRRAVISPDDIFLSAGGGAALALLKKAGRNVILNELAKVSGVRHRDVVVTSGGELPANYIFHAAATTLDKDANSKVEPDDVMATMATALRTAGALGVECLFLPLIGSGLEGMKPEVSLGAILHAVKLFHEDQPATPMQLFIVLRDEGSLARKDIGDCLEGALAGEFDVAPLT